MALEYKSEYKLSDDRRFATVSFTFRNVDEALAFHSMVGSLLGSMNSLYEVAKDTESWPEEDKKWL